MANKRKVKLPERFIKDQRWYIVQFTVDSEYSYPVPGNEVEDEDTGETATDRQFKIGDKCQAPWSDGKQYEGIIVFESDNKDECQKFRSAKSLKKGPKREATAPNCDKGADLTKKKKEKTASKKEIDINRKEVAIKEAHELFFNSIQLSQATHTSSSTSSDQLQEPSTSDISRSKPNYNSQTYMPTTPEHEQTQSKSTAKAKASFHTPATMQTPTNETQAKIQMPYTHTMQTPTSSEMQTSIQPAYTGRIQMPNQIQTNIQTTYSPTMQTPIRAQANILTSNTHPMQSSNSNTAQANIQTFHTSTMQTPIKAQANIQSQTSCTPTMQIHNRAQANIQNQTSHTSTVQTPNKAQPNIQTTHMHTMQTPNGAQANIQTPYTHTMQASDEMQGSICTQNSQTLQASDEMHESIHVQNTHTVQASDDMRASTHIPNTHKMQASDGMQTSIHTPNTHTVQASDGMQTSIHTIQASDEMQASIHSPYMHTKQASDEMQAMIHTSNKHTMQASHEMQTSTYAPNWHTMQAPDEKQASIHTPNMHTMQNSYEMQAQIDNLNTPTMQTSNETQANIQTPCTPLLQTPNKLQPLTITPYRTQVSIQTPYTPTLQTPYRTQTNIQTSVTPKMQTPLRELRANSQSTSTPNRTNSIAHQHTFMPTPQNIYNQDSTWTASLYAPLSEEERNIVGNECRECVTKDRRLSRMEQQISSLRAERTRLLQELGNLQSSNPMSCRQLQEEGHYYPRRGQRIDKCEYIIQEDENTTIPEDYVALVPGQPVYVKTDWLNHVQASFKGKSTKLGIKNMMSGLYEPEDVQGHTAISLIATPVGKALREYSIMRLGLPGKAVIDAINSKIATMTRALKFHRAQSQVEREKIIQTSNLMEIKELATRQKLRDLKEAMKSGKTPQDLQNYDQINSVSNGHVEETQSETAGKGHHSNDTGKGHHSNDEPKRVPKGDNSHNLIVNGWEQPETKTRPTTKDSGYGRSETFLADNTSSNYTRDNKFGSMVSVRSGSSQVIPGPDFYASKKEEKDPTSKWESNYSRPTTPSNLIIPESNETGYSVKDKGGAIVKEPENSGNKSADSTIHKSRSEKRPNTNKSESKSAVESQKSGINSDLIDSQSKQIEEELLNKRNRQEKERHKKPPLFENLPKNTQTYMPSEYVHGMNQGETFDARKMTLNSKNFDSALSSMLQEDNQNVYASYTDYDQFARTKAYKPSPYIQTVEVPQAAAKKPKPPPKSPPKSRERRDREERYVSAEKRLTKGQDGSPLSTKISQYLQQTSSPKRERRHHGRSSSAHAVKGVNISDVGRFRENSASYLLEPTQHSTLEIEEEEHPGKVTALKEKEREENYMSKAQVERDRISRIRKARQSAEMIQRCWRRYVARKRRNARRK